MRNLLFYSHFFKNKNKLFDIFLLFALSVLPFFWFNGIITNDAELAFSINPGNSFLNETFLWVENLNFGSPVYYGIEIYGAFTFVLSQLGIPVPLIKPIWLSFLVFVSGLSMYYLIGVFFGENKRSLRMISAFSYMYSVFLIRTIIQYSTALTTYAVFPIILGLYANGLKRQKKQFYYAVLISLSLVCFSAINYTRTIIYAIAILLFLAVYVVKTDKKQLMEALKFNVLILFFAFLMSSWWLLPISWNTISSREFITETLTAETPKTYNAYSSYFETFRLLGSHGLYTGYKGIPNVSFAHLYLKNNLWIIGTFLLTVLSLAGLLFMPKSREKKYLLLLLVFFIPLAVGCYPSSNPSQISLTGKMYLWAYDNVPLFSIFRNGYKSIAIIAFVYAVLLGYFAWSVNSFLKERFKKTGEILHKYLSVFFIFLVLGSISLSSFPLWSGSLFQGKNERLNFIPQYWYEFSSYINNQQLNFRNFVLPDQYFPVYSWGIPRGDITLALLNKPSIESYGKAIGYKKFTELFYDNVSNKGIFGKVLALGNIKYIIQKNDADWKYYDYTLSPEEIKKVLSGRDDLNFKNSFGEIDVYEVDDKYFLPRIYSPSSLYYLADDIKVIPDIFSFDDYNIKSGIFLLNSGLNKKGNIFNKIGEIFIPVGIDKAKVEELQTLADQTKDVDLKQGYEKKIDLYKNRVVLSDDYSLEIPQKAVYDVYIKKNSLLNGNNNLTIMIGGQTVIEANSFKIDREQYWYLFGRIELEKNLYDLQIYEKDAKISIVNPGDIVLRASNSTEPIATPKLEFTKINPVKYRVKVKESSEPFLLVFSESYHPGWKAYIQTTINEPSTNDNFVSEEIAGTTQNDNLPKGKFYETYFKKSVPEENHLLVNGYANSWWIDPQKDTNNKRDFEVILEFWPQRLFYLGLIISGFTFFCCFGYLAVIYWKIRSSPKI
jgi:hypothetical protein